MMTFMRELMKLMNYYCDDKHGGATCILGI